MALLNNFVVERANFDGSDIGLLQSVRDPCFWRSLLSLFWCLREQKFILLALGALTLGTAITGFFPSLFGLLLTTLLMSTGFHYFETLKQSLSLQWLSKDEAPEMLGKFISIGALASLFTYGALGLFGSFWNDYQWAYLIFGGIGFALVAWMALHFRFKPKFSKTKS